MKRFISFVCSLILVISCATFVAAPVFAETQGFVGVTIDFAQDLSVKITTNVDYKSNKDSFLKTSINGRKYQVNPTELPDHNCLFILKGISPFEIDKKINLVLYAKDGTVIDERKDFSVKKILLTMLDMDMKGYAGYTEQQEYYMRKTVSDILRYGGLAQEFSGAKDTVTADIKTENYMPTPLASSVEGAIKSTTTKPSGTYIKSAGIRYDSSCRFYFEVRTNLSDTSKIKVFANAYDCKMQETDPGVLRFYTAALPTYNLGFEIVAGLYVNDTCTQTIHYNLAAYLNSQDASSKSGKLVRALYALNQSANLFKPQGICYGDANGDNVVNEADTTLLAQYNLNEKACVGKLCLYNLDVDLSGSVDGLDLITLTKYVNGSINTLPYINASAEFGSDTLSWAQLKESANGTKYGYSTSNIASDSILDNAFNNNNKITKISTGSEIASIGQATFKNSSLKAVFLNAVSLIKASAFENCAELATIVLPGKVMEILDNAFVGTAYYGVGGNWTDKTYYKELDIGKHLIKVNTSSACDVTISDGILDIAAGAFKNCNINTLTVPVSVARITKNAFAGATVKEIRYNGTKAQWGVIPGAAEVICKVICTDGVYEDGLFDASGNLLARWAELGIDITTDISRKDLNNGTETLWNTIEEKYPNTTKVIVPFMSKIGKRRLGNLELDEIEFLGVAGTIGSYVMQDSVINKITFPYCPAGFVDNMLYGCEFEELHYENHEVTLKALCNKIPENAVIYANRNLCENEFTNCAEIKEIHLGASVTEIPAGCFKGCTNITNIYVAENNPIYKAQSKCIINKNTNTLVYAVGATEIPNGVAKISSYAFENDLALTNLVIPASVTDIEIESFRGCANISSISVASGNTVFEAKNGCLINKNEGAVILGSNTATIPENDYITTIKSYAFSSAGITAVTIPKNIKTIENFAFYECDTLADITIKYPVVIGRYAFCQQTSIIARTLILGKEIEVSSCSLGVAPGEGLTIYFDGTYAEYMSNILHTGGMSAFWSIETGPEIVYCSDATYNRRTKAKEAYNPWYEHVMRKNGGYLEFETLEKTNTSGYHYGAFVINQALTAGTTYTVEFDMVSNSTTLKVGFDDGTGSGAKFVANSKTYTTERMSITYTASNNSSNCRIYFNTKEPAGSIAMIDNISVRASSSLVYSNDFTTPCSTATSAGTVRFEWISCELGNIDDLMPNGGYVLFKKETRDDTATYNCLSIKTNGARNTTYIIKIRAYTNNPMMWMAFDDGTGSGSKVGELWFKETTPGYQANKWCELTAEFSFKNGVITNSFRLYGNSKVVGATLIDSVEIYEKANPSVCIYKDTFDKTMSPSISGKAQFVPCKDLAETEANKNGGFIKFTYINNPDKPGTKKDGAVQFRAPGLVKGSKYTVSFRALYSTKGFTVGVRALDKDSNCGSTKFWASVDNAGVWEDFVYEFTADINNIDRMQIYMDCNAASEGELLIDDFTIKDSSGTVVYLYDMDVNDGFSLSGETKWYFVDPNKTPKYLTEDYIYMPAVEFKNGFSYSAVELGGLSPNTSYTVKFRALTGNVYIKIGVDGFGSPTTWTQLSKAGVWEKLSVNVTSNSSGAIRIYINPNNINGYAMLGSGFTVYSGDKYVAGYGFSYDSATGQTFCSDEWDVFNYGSPEEATFNGLNISSNGHSQIVAHAAGVYDKDMCHIGYLFSAPTTLSEEMRLISRYAESYNCLHIVLPEYFNDMNDPNWNTYYYSEADIQSILSLYGDKIASIAIRK